MRRTFVLLASLFAVGVFAAGAVQQADAKPPPWAHSTTTVAPVTTTSVPSTTTTVPPTTTTTALVGACVGVAVAPGQFTQAFVGAAPSPSTFCLASGMFNQTAAVAPRSGDRFVGTGVATVLDGGGVTDSAIVGFCCSSQSNVTVSDLVVQNFTSATYRGAIKAGYGWTIERIESRYNRLGMELNTAVTLRASYLHDNTQYGLVGAGDGTRVLGNEIARNNTGNYDKGDAGAMKFCCASTTNVLIEDNNFHDNNGNGVWVDGGGANIVVNRNTVTNNSDTGIMLEIVRSGVISNNTVTGNAFNWTNRSCWWGAGIMDNTSPNVEVFGNAVTAPVGANGICAVDATRDDKFGPLVGLNVHDNIVRVRAPGVSGIVGNGAAFQPAANNRFTANTYYVTNVGDAAWNWTTYPIGWAAWQAGGNDATGQLLTW